LQKNFQPAMSALLKLPCSSTATTVLLQNVMY